MGVNNDEGLFALALIDDLLGEKVLQALAQLSVLQGSNILHGGRGGMESMYRLELEPGE